MQCFVFVQGPSDPPVAKFVVKIRGKLACTSHGMHARRHKIQAFLQHVFLQVASVLTTSLQAAWERKQKVPTSY